MVSRTFKHKARGINMSMTKKRPSLRTMADNNTDYLNNLKRNYSRRKDNIELIKSNRELAEKISSLSDLIVKKGGDL
jgi:hypothetical protein